jgi:hypothetical protein
MTFIRRHSCGWSAAINPERRHTRRRNAEAGASRYAAPIFWEARTETASGSEAGSKTCWTGRGRRSCGTGENPARWKGLLDELLPARSTVAPVEHHKVLAYADIPRFTAELRRRDSLSARALEYTILTAARTSPH